MSLAVLADHMASRGRGPDSMLIHMSPREVQGLQALAENHGGSLTINPETGLPEAGFLDKLLPAIIGFALAPMTAGTSLAFLGATPMASALTVGGLQTLRTGDIGKGIQAGLGAYGGASLGANLATAGTGAISSEVGGEALKAAGLTGEAALTAEADQIVQKAVGEKLAASTPFESLSAGADVVKNDPMKYLKANAKPLMYAVGPAILAGQSAENNMPKTTTGMISPYTFDPYSGTYTAANPYQATPTRAAGGGLMGFDDGGYNPGQLDFTQRSEPVVRMARGGVAHFAAGGGAVPGYAIGGDLKGVLENEYATAQNTGDYSKVNDLIAQNKISEADVSNTWSGFDTAGAAGLGVNYFAQNPDVAAAFAQNSYGMTPEAFAQTHYTNFGQAEGRTLGGGASTPVADTGGGLAALNTTATNTGANTDLKFGPGDDIVNTGGGGGGLPALNTAATNPYYFQVNPDVAAEYARNPLGLTPEQFAQTHYTNFGQKEGREFVPSAAASYAKANNQDLVTNTLKWIDSNPFATPEQINAAIKGSGMSTGDVNRALDSLVASGKISGSERYYIQQGKGLSAMADSTAKWLKDNPNATQTQIDAVLKAASMDTGDAQQVLAHGFQVADKDLTAATKYIQDNPDVARWITSDQGKAYVKEHPEFDAKDIAFTHYERYGKKEGRKWGEDAVKPPVVTPPVVTPPITYNTTGTNAPGGLESVLGLPPGVSGGGNTYVNPNGTITTRPDFSLTTNQVRDAYTTGGGSLGYEPYTPKTIEEFDTKYGSRLTGGSKQSLDYLTGKTKYSPVPYTPTGEVMKPYSESVLGIPIASAKKMYLFDPATKTYKINPDYAIPTYDKDGKKSLNLTNQDVINYVKSPEYSNDDAFVSWMTANNLSPEQVAAATGMSIADVYKKIKKVKPVEKVADTPVTGQNDGGGGGDANGGLMKLARGGMAQQFNLGDYSDGGRLLRGPGDGVSDSIPASIGGKRPARLADGEFVVPARIVSELGNGSTEAGARKLYAMMDRIQKARRGTVGRGRVAKNSRSEKYLPA